MKWFVVCSEYRCGPFASEAVALRRLEAIEAEGNCTAKHRVEAR